MKRLVLLLLTGCAAPTALPPPGTAMIEVSSGGSMFGGTSTQIYADGTTIQSVSKPGREPTRTVLGGPPQAFLAAAAVIAERGLRSKAAQVEPEYLCLDYGYDSVRADPPIAGFDQISAGCPDEAVSALSAAVLAALVVHEP